MKSKAKILPIIFSFVLVLSFVIAPMLALNVSAADEATATLSFASVDNRTSQTTSQQVWEENGITFTNDKAASTTNVGNYSAPVRLYANSKITVEYPGITKIVFNCNNNTYATALKNSIGDSATVSSKVVTVTFSTAQDSFTVEKLTAQVRVDSIDVYAQNASGGDCAHTNTTTTTAPATCEEAGSTTVVCLDCGVTVSRNEIPAAGHNYVDGACSVCKKIDPSSVDYSGRYHIYTKRSSGNYFYMTSDLGTASTKRYQAIDSGLTELPEEVSNPAITVFVVEKNADGTYYIYAEDIEGDAKYLGYTSGNSGALVVKSSAKSATFTPNEDGSYIVTINDGARNLALNNTSGNNYFAWYAPGQANNLYFVPFVESECEHSYDEGEITTAPTCSTEGVKTLTCTSCGAIKTEPVDIIDHIYGADNKCTMCGEIDPMSVDYSGRYYIFSKRSSGNYFYMTSDLGTASTKRYQAVDFGFDTLPEVISNPEHGCVFVFEKNDDGTYCIYVDCAIDDAKYLGYTSGNSGILVDKDSALKLNIKLGDGYYNISFADGESTRYLALNNSTGNDYFAFYTTLQVAGNLYLVDAAELKSEISGASVTIGSDLSMNYYVNLGNNENIADYKMIFTMNGKETVVTEYTVKDGEYVFTFTGIAPQCIGDNISAKLYLGDELVSEKAEYSVKAYAEALLSVATLGSELEKLVIDMLHYGAAAQQYKDYNTENLVNKGVASSTTAAPENDNGRELTETANEDVYFTAAGVRFDYNNKIYAKFTAASLEGITVKINGEEADIESLGNNVYIIYTDAIYANGFADKYVIELVCEDETVQTLTYSINSYAFAKCDGKEEAEMTDAEALALALYRYGVSAIAYANAN